VNDRAVTPSLGFILMFAVIISTAVLVSVVGIEQIDNFRDAQEVNNAERSIQLVKSNVDEIQQGRAVARSGEIDLDRGRMDVVSGSGSRIRIRVENTTTGPDHLSVYDETVNMGGLRYQLGDTTVGYEGGAVFRADGRTDAVMQANPSLVCTDDRALLSVVTLEQDRDRQLGAGIVTLTVERNTTTVEFPTNRSGTNSTVGRANVSVDVVDSPFQAGWERYFAEQPGWQATGSGGFVCAGPSGNGVDTYRIVRTHVNVSFTR
jgi:hypothetical protein